MTEQPYYIFNCYTLLLFFQLKLFQRRLRAGEINLMPLDIQQKTYESILSKMEELILEKKKNQSPYRT